MTDRELLELAAKACGYDTPHHWNDERLTLTPPVIGLCIEGVSTCWNPLEDDGDAFRLLVDLRMEFAEGTDDRGDPEWWVGREGKDGRTRYLSRAIENAPRASAREAIVRAAAEIGRAMS